MGKVINKSQKRASAVIAMMLGIAITFSAVIDSFGVTKNDYASEMEVMEREILDRAYADLMIEELDMQFEEVETIKIYDADNNLLKSVDVYEGETIQDQEVRKLVNSAELLTSHNRTTIYQVLK